MRSTGSLYAFGPFLLDPSRRLLQKDGVTVPLTPKAFDVLYVLLRHNGDLVTKDALLRAAWPDTVVDESSLTFQISVLRKVLDEKSDGVRYIATVSGRGYQFVGDVEMEAREVVVEERERTTVAIEESAPSRSLRAWVLTAVAVVAVLIAAWLWTRQRNATPATRGELRSLAVLPFKPIVVADRDESLELGMADALIARISSVDGVIVRPLTAVRRYSAIDSDPFVAGRELRVDAVVDGSIHRNGDRVRVRARLLRVSDGRQLWQEEFDHRYGEIFDMQTSLSSRVAGALGLHLSAQEASRLERRPTENLEAFRAYAMGRVHQLRVRPGDLATSVRYFERAIELDPQYAAAYAGLADVRASLPISADDPPAEHFRLARAAAEKALALDPRLSDAYAARASVRFWNEWDWPGAESDLRQAIALNAGNALARLRLAHFLSNLGRHDEARRQALEAQKLEPLSPIMASLSAQFTMQSGDLPRATQELQRVLRDHPGFWHARLNLGKVLEEQGLYEQALAELRTAHSQTGSNIEAQVMIGYLHGVRGNVREARAIADELVAMRRSRYVPPTKIALVYTGLGDRDTALTWLSRACEERDLGLTFLYANPRWKRLKDHPRFGEIQRCVNLPPWPQ